MADKRKRHGLTLQGRTAQEMRRAKIWEMVAAGCYTNEHIARSCGCSHATVSRDLKLINERAKEQTLALRDGLAAREIEVLRYAQRLALEAHDRSQQDEVTTEYEAADSAAKKTLRANPRLIPSRRKVRSVAGNASFLSQFIRAQELIMQVQGLIGRDKFDDTPVDQTPKLLRVVVQSHEEVQRYKSLRLDQVERMGIIEGAAKPSAGQEDDAE